MKSGRNNANRLLYAPFLLAFILLLIFLPTPAPGSITATNGSAGLQVQAGTTNDVWADQPASGQVFDRWIGDAELLDNPYAAHTTLVMPALASLTATFRTNPVWSPTTNILNGLAPGDPSAVNLIYYFPSNSAGLIFLFNGARASAAAFFTEGESLTFMRDAVAAGY